jgi:hypothetical protein
MLGHVAPRREYESGQRRTALGDRRRGRAGEEPMDFVRRHAR